MAFIPDGCSEVTLSWLIATSTEPCLNVFGVDQDSDMTATEIAEAVEAAVEFAWLPIFDENITLATVHVLTGLGAEATQTVNTEGALAYSMAPPQVTHLVKKNTGSSGRSQRGRMYLPAVDEANVNAGGFIDAGRLAILGEAAGDFLVKLTDLSVPMVLLHTDEEALSTPVTGLQVSPKVATQRRRVR